MKNNRIYKIDPVNMRVVSEYNNIKEITDKVWIYKVINGERNVFSDGYIYRREEDVYIDKESGRVSDKIHRLDKNDKMEIKYARVIELLKASNLRIPEICELCKQYGIKISEPTCRKLRNKFC